MKLLCPRCGAVLPEGSGEASCTACLLKAGMAQEEAPAGLDSHDSMVETEVSGSAAGRRATVVFTPPGVEELRALFPELEILSLIGRGGMGVVYKVRQPALDRLAALKLLPVETGGYGDFRERFQREARMLAALNHPNIVTIHDFGERQGHYFFLMEFVDGGDLSALIRAKSLKPREALAIIPQICEALQFAHDAGVVHRDIKPGNILVDTHGRVKIADFGVARLVGGAPDLGVPAEYVVGTPVYMAPEQHDRPVEVDHRADLYSLGVVLYEMLTGEVPRGKIVPPSRRVEVDVRIDEVVLRAMESDPTRRYQHASEFQERIERVLAPRRREGLRIAVGAGVAAVLVLGGAVFFWPRRQAPPPEPDPFPAPRVLSLGMKFRPVPGTPVQFSLWETRVSDWQSFAREGAPVAAAAPFEQGPDHPQTGVTLEGAEAFCRWLTKKEHAAGALKADEIIRLPTDAEWSLAVGLPEPDAASPEELHLKTRGQYPWGTLEPVPPRAGNYPDRALRERIPSALVVTGYYDGFAATAPVGSFQPNAFGLFDLGGNVWELVSTPLSPAKPQPVLRGGGWSDAGARAGWEALLSSYRLSADPLNVEPSAKGFRVVISSGKPEERPSLLAVVRAGDVEAVRARLAEKPDLAARDAFGRTALVLAIRNGSEEIATLLLEAGADVASGDAAGVTPLHEAAAAGQAGIAAKLLEKKADPSARTKFGKTPMHLAASAGHVPVMALLANSGAKVEVEDATGFTPLHEAVGSGPVEAVDWLLDNGAKLETEGVWHVTPLATACFRGDTGIMARLLAAGGNPDASMNGTTLLGLAAMNGNEDMMRLLLEHGADPKGPRLLFMAVCDPSQLIDLGARMELAKGEVPGAKPQEEALQRMGRLSAARAFGQVPGSRGRIVGMLLKNGADPNGTTGNGQTPLIFAALMGDAEVIEVLLDGKADLQAEDGAGFTALQCAAERGHRASAEVLIARGANLNARTKDERTAVYLAAASGRAEVLEVLLKAGADVSLRRSSDAMTPLMAAALNGHDAAVDLLLRHGADVLAESMVKLTALHFAAGGPAGAKRVLRQTAGNGFAEPAPDIGGEAAYERCVRLLLDKGASFSSADQLGSEPLHIAANGDVAPIVALLLERGARIEAVDHQLRTPLYFAAISNASRTAQVLLDRGAAVNALLAPWSALHEAAAAGSVEVAKLLVAKGADINALDSTSSTPLLHAINAGKSRMVTWLLEAGADIGKRDASWMSPLHRAVLSGSAEMVRLLCDKGADPAARDASSATPLQLAQQRNLPELATILVQAAARKRAAQPPPPK